MRKIEVTAAFKRDFKRESKRPNLSAFDRDFPRLVEALASDVPVAVKHRDHALTGNWKDYRDCHVRPDLVLIYRLMDGDGTDNNPARLVLARLGSHSELDL